MYCYDELTRPQTSLTSSSRGTLKNRPSWVRSIRTSSATLGSFCFLGIGEKDGACVMVWRCAFNCNRRTTDSSLSQELERVLASDERSLSEWGWLCVSERHVCVGLGRNQAGSPAGVDMAIKLNNNHACEGKQGRSWW